jgi:hypothetical protein
MGAGSLASGDMVQSKNCDRSNKERVIKKQPSWHCLSGCPGLCEMLRLHNKQREPDHAVRRQQEDMLGGGSQHIGCEVSQINKLKYINKINSYVISRPTLGVCPAASAS